MQETTQNRHNNDMSEKPEIQKPELEEDARLARFLGVVLFFVVTTFGFYYGTIFGKTNPVDGKAWFFDYQLSDLNPGFKGAIIGFAIAFVMNIYIWVRYKANTDRDLVNEWYEPQSHKSSGHH